MDQICCLLGLCCPPAQRQDRVAAMLVRMGCDVSCSSKVAQGLIEAIDNSALGHFLKAVVKHAGEQ